MFGRFSQMGEPSDCNCRIPDHNPEVRILSPDLALQI
jgi:hypothetical protein